MEANYIIQIIPAGDWQVVNKNYDSFDLACWALLSNGKVVGLLSGDEGELTNAETCLGNFLYYENRSRRNTIEAAAIPALLAKDGAYLYTHEEVCDLSNHVDFIARACESNSDYSSQAEVRDDNTGFAFQNSHYASSLPLTRSARNRQEKDNGGQR